MKIVNKYNEKKKPKMASIDFDNIPEELKNKNCWVNWYWKWDGKKWTKPCCSEGGININHLQSDRSFKSVVNALKNNKNLGIGFSLRKEDKFCGIDFDDCLDKKGKPNKRLNKAIKLLQGAYIERSPSGMGVRVFGVGKPTTRGSSGAREIEIYNSGRYLTVTGQKISKSKGSLINIEKACKKIDKKIYKDKEASKDKSSCNKNSLAIHENSNPKITQFRKYQNVYDQEDRPQWIKFGQIVHYETNGSQEGFDYWNWWSKGTTADNYSEEDAKGVWKSFKKKNKGEALTISSLIYDAEQSGNYNRFDDEYESIDISKFMKRYTVRDKDTNENDNSVLLYKGISIENQLTVIVAPPNAGKSAIMFFRVSPDLAKSGKNVLYIDVDSAASDRTLMQRFAKKHQFNFINPDAKKKRSTSDLINDLHNLSASDNDLTNFVFIIDTMKKLNDMMSKTDTKRTFDVFKRLVGKGATIIVLAHSNKFADKQGDWVYEGTNDMLSEPDALIYLYFEKDKETKDVIITTYPYKERAEIGQVTFNIRGGDRDLSNINELVTKDKKVVDVRLDGKEYKGLVGKKHTVKEMRMAIDRIILFDGNEWTDRKEIEDKLKGSIGRDKLKGFLSEYSEGDKNHYQFKRGKSNKFLYRIRKGK